MYRSGGIALLLCLLVTEVTAEPYPTRLLGATSRSNGCLAVT
jgi:hypothetical protein